MGVKGGGSVGCGGTAATTLAPPQPAVCTPVPVATAGAGGGEGRPPRQPLHPNELIWFLSDLIKADKNCIQTRCHEIDMVFCKSSAKKTRNSSEDPSLSDQHRQRGQERELVGVSISIIPLNNMMLPLKVKIFVWRVTKIITCKMSTMSSKVVFHAIKYSHKHLQHRVYHCFIKLVLCAWHLLELCFGQKQHKRNPSSTKNIVHCHLL